MSQESLETRYVSLDPITAVTICIAYSICIQARQSTSENLYSPGAKHILQQRNCALSNWRSQGDSLSWYSLGWIEHPTLYEPQTNVMKP